MRSLKKEDIRDDEYETSQTRRGLANMQRIYWRAKPHEAVDATPENNFILKHQEWVEPEYVLKVEQTKSR